MTDIMERRLFHYDYPRELVAQQPLPERDLSRLLVLNRTTGTIRHARFTDLSALLRPKDLLVFNDTRVFPARLFAADPNGKPVEILLLQPEDSSRQTTGGQACQTTGGQAARRWRALAKPMKRATPGTLLQVAGEFSGRITARENGFIRIEWEGEKINEKIEAYGFPPLPPYIQRKKREDYSPRDRERYQSIFAQINGSAAAPTASLHFTPFLLQKIGEAGAQTAFLTLHVSADTFLPIREERVEDHPMHGEFFHVPEATRKKISETKAAGGRVIAVGTTVVRALESGWEKPLTRLFITPGFRFQRTDAMLTNFHQPESTLLCLVGAFAGIERIRAAYAEAIGEKYRLFSYGDAMWVG